MKVDFRQPSAASNASWEVPQWLQSLQPGEDKLFNISKKNLPNGVKVDFKLNTHRLNEASKGLKIMEMWKQLTPGQKKFTAGAGAATAIFATPLFIASSVVYGAYELFLRKR